VADLVETYYLEHVKKTNEVDEFFYKLIQFSYEHGEGMRMESLVDRVIEFTKNENQDLARMLAIR
jgi:hypothetical protein